MRVSHVQNIKQENKDVYHLEHRCTYQAVSKNKTIHLKGFDSLLSAHTLFDSLIWHLESTHACMQLRMEMFSWLLHVANFLSWLHLKLLGMGALLSILKWGNIGRGWEKSGKWKMKKKKEEKTPWNEKSISNVCKFISFPNFLLSLLLPISKISIHFLGLWCVLDNPFSSRTWEQRLPLGDFGWRLEWQEQNLRTS